MATSKPTPPVPDRSKKPADPEEQQYLHGICQLYDRTMFLIAESASRGQTLPGHTGLVNFGNTGFMNCVLQVFFNTPGIDKIFGQKNFRFHLSSKYKAASKGLVSVCFSSYFDSVWSGQFKSIRPDLFLNVFSKVVNPSFGDGQPHDVQEFLAFLIDALQEETDWLGTKKTFEQDYSGQDLNTHAEDFAKKMQLFTSSPVNDIFAVRTVTQLTCMTCNTSCATFADNSLSFIELPFKIASNCTLEECFEDAFGDRTLDGVHKWYCPTCKIPQISLQSTRIWALPSVLIFCLKRTAFENGGFVKNNVNVIYPIKNLNMAPYIHKDAPLKMEPRYELYAVAYHDGNLYGGVCTSKVHNNKTNQWLRFSDESVNEVSQWSAQSKDAYVLFYKSVNA